jgi:hypothetical protein
VIWSTSRSSLRGDMHSPMGGVDCLLLESLVVHLREDDLQHFGIFTSVS